MIGQIHASNDEPIRLYYLKLPNHEKGFIYFAHERAKGLVMSSSTR
jgi:poly(beta-D-mannuronate) lyase